MDLGMTRDEILEIARECGMWGQIEHHSSYVLFSELLQFTRRVQEWEREECAKVLEDFEQFGDTRDCIAAIRARGQA
jgi:hypothetical protein